MVLGVPILKHFRVFVPNVWAVSSSLSNSQNKIYIFKNKNSPNAESVLSVFVTKES